MWDEQEPPEPGIDRHEWETELAALEPLLEDDPESALPDLLELVERMLEVSEVPERDLVAQFEPEVYARFGEARDLAQRSRQGADLPPGDVAHAIGLLRELAASVLAGRP